VRRGRPVRGAHPLRRNRCRDLWTARPVERELIDHGDASRLRSALAYFSWNPALNTRALSDRRVPIPSPVRVQPDATSCNSRAPKTPTVLAEQLPGGIGTIRE